VSDAYAAAGVDMAGADLAVSALVGVLAGIETGSPSRSVLPSGHYAAVLEVAPNLGIAVGTDSAGSKVIVAEQTGRFDTIGIDCVAMNVNDVICVGATPIALLDYLAVEHADPEMLRQIGVGLRVGASAAGVEIPGGELAVLPEVIRGHPSPRGFDIVGTCFGIVALDALVTGATRQPGDAVIGLPSSGIHSNGFTLARRALLSDATLRLDDRPVELGGSSVGDALLEPTVIYVRAVLDLLRSSSVEVRGLAHITGGGVLNLLRLHGEGLGFELDAPLPVPPVFDLIAAAAGVPAVEMWEVFNMGCGFACVVPAAHEALAVGLLSRYHPGAARIGRITEDAGRVVLPSLGIEGRRPGALRVL
jgi:phosphoribosylformylglycinamidine cyclo-ligase